MLDSFFYAAKPRLSEEPRQCKLCSRTGMLAIGRRKLLPLAQPSLPPLSLSSLGRFAPSATEICAKNQPSSQATPSLIFYLISTSEPASEKCDAHFSSLAPFKPRSLRFARSLGPGKLHSYRSDSSSQDLHSFVFNMQTLHSSHPSLGAASRLSLSSLCRFAPSAKKKSALALDQRSNRSLDFWPKERTLKRKGLESQRRLSDLPRPRWGTSHLRASHGRASLVTLKRKGRMSYRRYRNLHTTCCILQHLQQSCCRTLCLVPLKRKDRLTEIDGIKICVEKILWSPPYFSLSFELQEITRFFFLLDFVQKKRPSPDRDRRSRKSAQSHRHLLRSVARRRRLLLAYSLRRCGVLLDFPCSKKTRKEKVFFKERRKQRTPKLSLIHI